MSQTLAESGLSASKLEECEKKLRRDGLVQLKQPEISRSAFSVLAWNQRGRRDYLAGERAANQREA